MNDKNYQNQFENNEGKGKKFWCNFGVGCLALFVAVLTIVVINLR